MLKISRVSSLAIGVLLTMSETPADATTRTLRGALPEPEPMTTMTAQGTTRSLTSMERREVLRQHGPTEDAPRFDPDARNMPPGRTGLPPAGDAQPAQTGSAPPSPESPARR